MADEEHNAETPETPDEGAGGEASAPDPDVSGESVPEAVAGSGDAEAAIDGTQEHLDATAEGVDGATEPTEGEAAALAAVQSALAGITGDAAAAAQPAAPAPSAAPAPMQTGAAGPAAPGGAEPFEAPEFNRIPTPAHEAAIDLLGDVNLNVTIELGRTRMMVEDVLRLNEGAVVELDKLAGDPVDVYVNGRQVARGEVLVLNDTFCVRVNQVLDAAAEISSKGK